MLETEGSEVSAKILLTVYLNRFHELILDT